ncbi:hypothetical protein LO772_12205 [Yinghuangia sp. ASG 101]|uniref:hypothetical protein n=1 Tax=Yinghuangia sp. ASG 101 TaxID=2896848 RepID=UPI001E616E67|nr:hypothetical protein [Yinghuangia sp. ASG 101]UGQ14278.1 hypothetical protein LO772_12205 [Yinghuangia sp. ASG 101]
MSERIDIGAGANVLRCFADFVSARPGLPPVVCLRVTWSHTDHCWEVEGQLASDAGVAEVERWGIALDDAVITAEDGNGQYLGPYVKHTATGTVHGHLVSVWTTLGRSAR